MRSLLLSVVAVLGLCSSVNAQFNYTIACENAAEAELMCNDYYGEAMAAASNALTAANVCEGLMIAASEALASAYASPNVTYEAIQAYEIQFDALEAAYGDMIVNVGSVNVTWLNRVSEERQELLGWSWFADFPEYWYDSYYWCISYADAFVGYCEDAILGWINAEYVADGIGDDFFDLYQAITTDMAG